MLVCFPISDVSIQIYTQFLYKVIFINIIWWLFSSKFVCMFLCMSIRYLISACVTLFLIIFWNSAIFYIIMTVWIFLGILEFIIYFLLIKLVRVQYFYSCNSMKENIALCLHNGDCIYRLPKKLLAQFDNHNHHHH